MRNAPATKPRRFKKVRVTSAEAEQASVKAPTMTNLVSNNPKNVKADVARQLQEAVREADAYGGSGPVNYFRGHGHFDRVTPEGFLWHDKDGVTPMPDGETFIPCPYCRVRRLQRLQRCLWQRSERKSRHEYQ